MRKAFCLIFIVFVMFANVSFSDEQRYSKENAEFYLSSVDGVYVVVKVGGEVSFPEYELYMNQYAALDEAMLYELWKSGRKHELDRFLILKSIKGSVSMGSIVEANQLGSFPAATSIGEKYVVFMVKENNQMTYGQCDAIKAEKIPAELLSDLKGLVSFVANSNLTPCLY